MADDQVAPAKALLLPPFPSSASTSSFSFARPLKASLSSPALKRAFESTGEASSSTLPPLKRRLFSTSDLKFFVPAEDSFKPRPYTPHQQNTTPHPQSERPVRPVAAHTLTNLNLDPTPSDPDAIFLRYPFPDHPEGITYTSLAENQSWFLHPDDYRSESSPDATPYPTELEPPRGWCPAKKKDVKEKGAEGWPDGEQPRLRCTFCRRTYAGVNAKSMWRRHVFEKHKIAMSNRRTENERPRGRTSNKENKDKRTLKRKEEDHDVVLDLEAPGAPLIPQGEFLPPLDCPPPSPVFIPPASPYNPLLTPSFRHSPPRLPSDQPWRFPSPSHPSRELSLVAQGDSPAIDSPISALTRGRLRANTTPMSSPLRFQTPEGLGKLKFPRPLFALGRSHTVPLDSAPPSVDRRHGRTSSGVSEDWNIRLLDGEHNPFVAAAWGDSEDSGSPPASSPEGDEPVVKHAQRPSGVGLGIGLLEPFVLPDSSLTEDVIDPVKLDELIHLDEDAE
ncbi:hypothetical protein FB45DRAFT_557164 [Roridomyces roridus]|uniref:Uncharacterized protein n=1 Tax=Roridomyces roridus TaxID=1738132 RepID=A0AAD7FPW7_9AGAR|nr:hypothetical protein FB45DRAFT_557164 [Roridomyces roridus]